MSLLRLFLATLWVAASGAALAAPRYNLISIVTDDQAEWSVGAYGNKENLTPNMDRLATEGARFANAFTVTPVCSPSRVAFMTGRFGTQISVTDWIAPNEAHSGIGLPGNAMIWPKVLQMNGYATALIGKWHLGEQAHNRPLQMGFDHFFGFWGGGNTPMNPTYDFPTGPKRMTGYGADLLTDDAIEWLTAQKGKAQPFALCLHFREPHLPYGPVPEVDREAYANLDPTVPQLKGLEVAQIKKWTRDYYSAIHSVDRNMGRLFAFLEKEGLWNTTIISFTSDHGYNIGHHMIHTKGNGFWVAGGVTGPKRPNMWDTSMRIPWMVRWPGVVKPGTVIQEHVQNIDVFGSFLSMLDVPAPADWKTEGRNFAPLLRGDSTPWKDETYAQYDLHNSGLAYLRMIRTERWKFVKHFHENMMDELYDLQKDPGETHNIIAAKKSGQAVIADIVKDLRQKLLAWQKSIDDPILSEPRLMDYQVVEDKE